MYVAYKKCNVKRLFFFTNIYFVKGNIFTVKYLLGKKIQLQLLSDSSKSYETFRTLISRPAYEYFLGKCLSLEKLQIFLNVYGPFMYSS